MKKTIYAGLIIILILIILGCTQPISKTNITNQDNNLQDLFKKDTNNYDCINSTEYQWCEEKQKCLKISEEFCSSIQIEDNIDINCITNIKKEMDKFITRVEESDSNIFSFDFGPVKKNCYDENNSTMIIELIKNDINFCQNNCNKETDSCFVMRFYSPDLNNIKIEKCINLPNNAEFMDTHFFCYSPHLPYFYYFNPTKIKIISGNYYIATIDNNFDPKGPYEEELKHLESKRLICTYRKYS